MWLGSLVGGCSSINAALYFRPADDYITSSNWPFPAERVQDLMTENAKLHGVTDRPSPDGKYYNQEAYEIVASAFEKIDYAEKKLNNPDAPNARDKSYGHAIHTYKNGLRDSPAKAFWNEMKTRPNVKLVTSATVNYVRQAKGKATAVVYNNDVEVPLTTRGAVVMAAGALGTPQVLIQSGIGPKDQLELLDSWGNFTGVTASANGGWVVNENVGKSLFDTNVVFASFSHPKMKSFQYKNRPPAAINQFVNMSYSGPWASSGSVLIGFENYEVAGRQYEFQTTVLTAGFGEFYQNNDSSTTSLYVNNPEGRDSAYYSTEGKWSAFTQDTAYLGTSRDLQAMQSYATKVVEALTADGATFLSAKKNQSTADWVAESYKGYITHHFGGSCYASGDASDGKRCADANLRVVGTSNVFVGDASAMKEGSMNPYGFVMYIGREAAEQVQSFLGVA